MKPHIEFIGALQNDGFWLAQVYTILGHAFQAIRGEMEKETLEAKNRSERGGMSSSEPLEGLE